MPSLGLWRLVELLGASLSLYEGCLVAVAETEDAFTTFVFRSICRCLLLIDLRPSPNSFVSSVKAYFFVGVFSVVVDNDDKLDLDA